MAQPFLDFRNIRPDYLMLHQKEYQNSFTKDELNIIQCNILNQNNLNEGYIRPIVYSNEGLESKRFECQCSSRCMEWPSQGDPIAKEKEFL